MRRDKGQNESQPEIRTEEWRGRIVLACFAVAFGLLVIRAVDLQVTDRDFLTEEGNKRHVRSLLVPAGRGAIRDRRGEPLALSAPVESVWAVPGSLLEEEKRLGSLASLLEIDESQLRADLKKRSTRQFMYLRRHMQPSQAKRVLALDLPGVFTQREYRRFYPAAEVTAQMVGFTDIDNRGQEGIELALEELLHGEKGSRRVIKDRMGRVVDDLAQFIPPRPGEDVDLTIDLRLQYIAYRELARAVTDHKAKGGLAIIADPHTGDILAAASYPSFNPNRREDLGGDGVRFRPATDVFEPGSTFKPLVVARAIEQGLYGRNSIISTHGGTYRVGRLLVRDFRNYGDVSLKHLLTKSSNVGAAKIGLALGAKRLWSNYHDFGFGIESGIGFPGENSGVLRPHHLWGEVHTATASYGYGVSVNALQLVRAYSALAADGMLPSLRLWNDGREHVGERIMSARTAQLTREFMTGVVTEQGTARRAAIPGYEVVGKTGTVRKVAVGGYAADRHQSFFVGMVPAAKPQLVGMVMIDEPGGKEYYGGAVAAPAFSSMVGQTLRLLRIPPADSLVQSTDKVGAPS